jgi:acetyl esterase/lipase
MNMADEPSGSAAAVDGVGPSEQSRDAARGVLETLATHGFEPERVGSIEDLSVPRADARNVAVRVYRPDAGERVPVVVWAHGGFWTQLTVDVLDGYFRFIANRSGCAIAAVDFQPAPTARFPTALEEIHASACWLRQNGAALAVDTDRIGIAGDCAGGNLAAAATLLDRDRSEVGYIHQALLVPLLDARLSSPSWDELGTGYMLARADVEKALEQYAPDTDRTHPLLSPLCAPDLSGLPPALVVVGEHDPLRDDGERYAVGLAEAGVPVQLMAVSGLLHHAIIVPRLIHLGRDVVERSARAIGAALAATTA